MKKFMKGIFNNLIFPQINKFNNPLIRYLVEGFQTEGYQYYKKIFIQNEKKSRFDEKTRRIIIERFERIDREIPIGSTLTDGIFLAEALLSMKADGMVVECGCYAGGSTAKLSIITKLLGKSLYIFDSFEGLPKVNDSLKKDFHTRRSSEWVTDWTDGRYAQKLSQVKKNIKKYGEISVCNFYKGWFNETLNEKNLPNKISFAFIDVDLANSARECLKAIWPRISEGGIYFSHDVAYINVLKSILDEDLWIKIFKEFPPILFGAGYGLSNSSPHLGFFVKGKSIKAEYIKHLIINK